MASEPYGVVEETTTYLRMDGETPADPPTRAPPRSDRPLLGAGPARSTASSGWPTTARRCRSRPTSWRTAEITTRDIDRGGFPHFLLKEITEAPASFRKTLRGQDRSSATAGSACGSATRPCPPRCAADLRAGRIRRVVVIGQGTAAVAGQSVAAALATALARRPRAGRGACWPPSCRGSSCADDMSDTLVVAVSQSGTTTDTNRTVDLVRARGGAGGRHRQPPQQRPGRQGRRRAVHLRRSRRRDERGVDQGVLRPGGRRLPAGRGARRARSGCGTAPTRRAAGRPARAARRHGAGPRAAAGASPTPPGGSRRAGGTGPSSATDPTASPPTRCGSSCPSSATSRSPATRTEDKKHIDLSSEPLILVCAAGLSGSTADDVAKEVAIYRAHKAAPVVIATEGEERFSAALQADRRCPRSTRPGVRAVGHGRAPVRLRGGPVHRRPGPAAAGGPGRHRGGGVVAAGGPAATATTCSTGSRPTLEPVVGPVLRRAAQPATTTATSRPARPCGWHRSCATPLGSCPLEAYQVEHGKVGHAERAWSRT